MNLFFFQFFKTLDYAPRSASKLYDAVKCVASASDLRKFDDRINKLNGYIVRDIGSDALAQVSVLDQPVPGSGSVWTSEKSERAVKQRTSEKRREE